MAQSTNTFGRSEDIDLYRLQIDKDEERAVVFELGKMGCVQFIDLNKDLMPTELPYTEIIKVLERAQTHIK